MDTTTDFLSPKWLLVNIKAVREYMDMLVIIINWTEIFHVINVLIYKHHIMQPNHTISHPPQGQLGLTQNRVDVNHTGNGYKLITNENLT